MVLLTWALGPGARKRDAVEAMIMKRGRDAGLGGGYVSTFKKSA